MRFEPSFKLSWFSLPCMELVAPPEAPSGWDGLLHVAFLAAARCIPQLLRGHCRPLGWLCRAVSTAAIAQGS